MKPAYPFFIILIISILALVISNTLTGGTVVNYKDPCRMIRCNVQLFGFIQTPPEWIGTTPDGMAICHCPQESMDYLFYVDIKPRH
jgi:Na+-translocating ferredoxin:NAD+ oxidoreductase RnfD subunit